jgi:diguanylate cyclase (GGDEF)-like protein
LTVAVLHLERFKAYTDRYGLDAGHRLLAFCSVGWSVNIRASDLLARIADEEFGLLLPECTATAARVLLARLADATADLCSFSAGIAEWDREEATFELVERADEALYEAKRRGRDRFVTAALAGVRIRSDA